MKDRTIFGEVLGHSIMLGIGTGALLGSMYAAVFVIGNAFASPGGFDLGEDVPGVLILMLFACPFGLIIGGVLGGIIGVCTGLLSAILTVDWFFPIADKRTYRMAIGSVSGVLGAFVGFLISPFVVKPFIAFGITDALEFWMWSVAAPSVIIGLAAFWAGGRVADGVIVSIS